MKKLYICNLVANLVCILLLLIVMKKQKQEQEPIDITPWGTLWRQSIEPGYVEPNIEVEPNAPVDAIYFEAQPGFIVICNKCPPEKRIDVPISICPGHTEKEGAL